MQPTIDTLLEVMQADIRSISKVYNFINDYKYDSDCFGHLQV